MIEEDAKRQPLTFDLYCAHVCTHRGISSDLKNLLRELDKTSKYQICVMFKVVNFYLKFSRLAPVLFPVDCVTRSQKHTLLFPSVTQ